MQITPWTLDRMEAKNFKQNDISNRSSSNNRNNNHNNNSKNNKIIGYIVRLCM